MTHTLCTTKRLLFVGLYLVSCSQKNGEIPTELSNIEGDAEHAYDMALAEDYVAAHDAALSIQTSWQTYRDVALADGATETVLTQLDDAIANLLTVSEAGVRIDVGRAANAISAPMPELFALYNPSIPPAILELDYEGRAIVLDGMEEDFATSITDVENLSTTWNSIKQQVVDAGGTTEAADFDASVQRLTDLAQGSDVAGLIEEANINLELVDVLEGLF